ncbi:MAG: ribonuclease III [Akkermansiaceae bacterium]|nr:ribonuclease III [Akkermansiaceae bacterium]NNM31142.1 ribonuclease III [Akkermansiaceae bacterium]
MDALEERLGYQFEKKPLLRQALTHPSLSAEKKGAGADNQRLEFLGDAVLQLVLTEYLYGELPEDGEGRLTQTRATLVSRKALAECAQRLELGGVLRLGRGEDANGGRERESNLADAIEALIGAVYLDGGLEAARKVVLLAVAPVLVDAIEGEDTSNPKGRLQEELQAITRESPVYRIVSEEGPDHLKRFAAEVVWRGRALAIGYGSSKKIAEADAAEQALASRGWE